MVLNIENETLCDKSIEKIHILDRHTETGYAKQNNLIPGKWIDIHFNTDVPVIITGEILTIHEDMIEVKLYPTNTIIYVDFEYKGLKPDFNMKNYFKRSTNTAKK